MLDGEGFCLEVYGFVTQPEGFVSSEPVEQCWQYHDFKRVALGHFEQSLDLFLVAILRSCESLLLRHFDTLDRVVCDYTLFHGTIQAFGQVSKMPPYGVGA